MASELQQVATKVRASWELARQFLAPCMKVMSLSMSNYILISSIHSLYSAATTTLQLKEKHRNLDKQSEEALGSCTCLSGHNIRAAAHQLRQDKHQDRRRKRQKLTSAL
jgi:hypothetical protein